MNTQPQEIALIIGGSSGMGKETARQLLQRGIHVLIHGRNQDKLETAGIELGKSDL